MTRFRKLLLASLAACAGWLPFGALASPFAGIVVFGDSLADNGNNALAFDTGTLGVPAGTRTTTPIASSAFIPDFPYSSDRYSNGPVWVEQLAARLGLPVLTPSEADGTDFAYGGARLVPGASPFPVSLTKQVSMFLSGGAAPSN